MPENDKHCPICNVAVPNPEQKYCSRACRDEGHRVRETRECPQCHTTFMVAPCKSKMYCSLKCAKIASNAKLRKTYPIKSCAACGKQFEHKRRDTDGKFCSRTCSDSTRKVPEPQPKIPTPCAYCGEIFMREPWQPNVKHCSTKCAKRTQAKTMRGKNHPLYKPKVEMSCVICGKKCMVKPCLVSRFKCCSRRCAGVLIQQTMPRTSSIEYAMLDALRKARLNPEHQKLIGYYTVDIFLTEYDIVIECDGDYWHELLKQKRIDASKDSFLRNRGYTVFRFGEKQIKSNVNECVKTIKKFIATGQLSMNLKA